MCTFGQKWKWSGRARDDYVSVISDRKWPPKKRPVIAQSKQDQSILGIVLTAGT